MAYNRAVGTVIIADNSITGMTGHQNNPANGYDIHGEPTTSLDILKLCDAMGIKHVRVVDPFDVKELERLFAKRPSVKSFPLLSPAVPVRLLLSSPARRSSATQQSAKTAVCV